MSVRQSYSQDMTGGPSAQAVATLHVVRVHECAHVVILAMSFQKACLPCGVCLSFCLYVCVQPILVFCGSVGAGVLVDGQYVARPTHGVIVATQSRTAPHPSGIVVNDNGAPYTLALMNICAYCSNVE